MSAVCGFCGGTADVVGDIVSLGKVHICGSCAGSFSHQLGYSEGQCSNCGRRLPEAVRLHGEGELVICEVCLEQGGRPAPTANSEPSPPAPELTHLTAEGDVHMVDVGAKDVTERRARAEAIVSMSSSLADRLFEGDLPKGDALATVRLAGIMAAKRTPELIPLAHPIALTSVTVEIERHPEGVRIVAECALSDRTGVEMEAMTAVSVAALTLYDMVKSVERGVVIGPVRLLHKSGGRSGTWEADTASSLADS